MRASSAPGEAAELRVQRGEGDAFPQGLKPHLFLAAIVRAEALTYRPFRFGAAKEGRCGVGEPRMVEEQARELGTGVAAYAGDGDAGGVGA